MKEFVLTHKKSLLAVGVCILLGAMTMSFQTPFGPMDKIDTLTELQDTVPQVKREDDRMTMDEYNNLILKMDKEILKMQEEIGKVDFSQVHKDIAASLDKVDFEKIEHEINNSMKNVDFSKIEKGVQSALSEIEWNKLNADVKRSLQDAKKEIEKVDMQEVRKELEKAKKEIEKSKKEIEKINIDQLLQEANTSILKAKEELQLTKVMFNEMEKEGLIVQKDGFSIEFKNKALFINGKKQPEATYEKYRHYNKGDSFKIKISK